jgi:hypothetical protein
MVQNHRNIVSNLGLSIMLLLCGMGFVSMAEGQNFENVPISLRVSEVFPKDLLSGPNYTIKETVKSDGMVNIYGLDTQYGPLTVESTALLFKRVGELRALSKIEELKGTNVYMDALKASAQAPVTLAKDIVTSPVETAKGVGSGIGNFFTKVGDSITSSSPDKDKPLNAALGQAAFKREFAFKFGIDPYTSYEPLKKALDDVAWTAAGGSLTVTGAFMAIPGAGGMVVGYSRTSETMRNLVRDKTPPELDKINRAKLRGMNVADSLASLFLSSTSYGPQEKTFLVGALADMTGVKDRGIFVQKAAIECEESVALFMRLRAEMMSRYFQKAKNVDRFVSLAGVPFLLTKNGMIVGIFPLDYVAWAPAFAQKEGAISAAVEKMAGVKGKELWITGVVDPAAQTAMESKGWKVKDKVSTDF